MIKWSVQEWGSAFVGRMGVVGWVIAARREVGVMQSDGAGEAVVALGKVMERHGACEVCRLQCTQKTSSVGSRGKLNDGNRAGGGCVVRADKTTGVQRLLTGRVLPQPTPPHPNPHTHRPSNLANPGRKRWSGGEGGQHNSRVVSSGHVLGKRGCGGQGGGRGLRYTGGGDKIMKLL